VELVLDGLDDDCQDIAIQRLTGVDQQQYGQRVPAIVRRAVVPRQSRAFLRIRVRAPAAIDRE
jgi:hypothetical protein